MDTLSWDKVGIGVVVLGVVVLSLPDSIEGPRLIELSEGHALSVLDLLGAVLLIVGSTVLRKGIWKRKDALFRQLNGNPNKGVAIIFCAGLSLGLLIASAFSSFYWWWAIGAIVFLGLVVYITLAASKEG